MITLFSGWILAEENTMIDFNLENEPLEVKTESFNFDLCFYTSIGEPIGVKVRHLKILILYRQYPCILDLSTPPLTDQTNVWRTTLVRNMETRLQIHVNEVLALDFLFSDLTCGYLNRKVEKIEFIDVESVGKFFYIGVPRLGCSLIFTNFIILFHVLFI